MPSVSQILGHPDLPIMVLAVVLVLAAVLLIKLGKLLLTAGVFGASVGGASLLQGTEPQVAAIHAALGFGVATVTLVLIKLTKHLILWLLIPAICALFFLSCNRSDGNTVRLPNQTARRGDEPPVMINPVSPVEYPPMLLARGIEGKVVLRLRVDESGRLDADSTKLAESSGYPALDSAAMSAVPQFRFAPALHNGSPVAATFLQPIHFRHPEAGGTTP
jgi:TonB family protein